MAPQNRPQPTNAFQFQRSAIEPVGIVAVVSMKATMYRNIAATGAAFLRLCRLVSAKPPCQRNTQFPLPISGPPVEESSPKAPEKLKPPNMKAYPTRKNPTKPRPNTAKFVETTCAACLARQKPVSTRANPACMKMTRTAPMTTQSMLRLMATSLGATEGAS